MGTDFILEWLHLGVRNYIRKLQTNYVIKKVENTRLPDFDSSPLIRKRMIFSGRVQKVGFRLETYQLSNRLNLTGWVKIGRTIGLS